jgi:DNA-binding response OmpR family regulator
MQHPSQHPTVLIADDEPAIVDLLADFLEDQGFNIERAYDGASALRIIRRTHPDLVIADVMMPHLDGYGLVREMENGSDGIPVILMSAAVTSRRQDVSFIAKPFDLDTMLDLITHNLNLNRSR